MFTFEIDPKIVSIDFDNETLGRCEDIIIEICVLVSFLMIGFRQLKEKTERS